jgi:peptide/nickel transport system ATP-binding protein
VSDVTTTTAVAADDGAAGAPDLTPGRRGFLATVLRGQPQAAIGLIVVVAFILIAIFAPLIATHSIHAKTGPIYQAPNGNHWLGTDDGGVDMFSLLVFGSRVSLEVGFAAAFVAMVIGGSVGIISGFFGGWVDVLLMRITDIFLVIPDLPLIIVVAAIFGRHLINIIIIIGIIYWTSTARLVRAQVKSVRERVYVQRARSIGAGNNRLVFKHVLPRPCGLPRDVHHVPRPRRPQHDLVGQAHREQLPRERRPEQRVVGHRAAGRRRDGRDPGLHHGRPVDGGRPEPAPAGRAPGRAPVPPAAAPRTAGERVNREPVLKTEDLHVWFDLAGGRELHAVQGVSFELRPGERMGLVGESGCGKTTTILALMGLLPASASVAGRVYLNGEDVLAKGEETISPHRWRDVAMVFQGAMNAFNPVKTIGSQIAEPMELHGTASGRTARGQVRELLELVGISGERADRYPHEFSGGMRQRAAIALALACQPQVLLADEPTTALDVMVQAQILELLVRLTRDLGLSMILVTHDLPVVAQVCDRAAVMYAGEIVEMGEMATIYHDPRHPYTRMLFAATPDLLGDEEVLSIPGAPPRLDREIAGCPFTPRCDSAFAPCPTTHPRRLEVGPGHEALCHLNDHLVAERPA